MGEGGFGVGDLRISMSIFPRTSSASSTSWLAPLSRSLIASAPAGPGCREHKRTLFPPTQEDLVVHGVTWLQMWLLSTTGGASKLHMLVLSAAAGSKNYSGTMCMLSAKAAAMEGARK